MRDYELMYIVRPELDDEELHQAVERVNGLIAGNGGEVVKVSHWGRRKLAYEIDRQREGYYVVADLKLDPVSVPEIERNLQISDTVFRHLLVRPTDEQLEASRARAAMQAELEASGQTDAEEKEDAEPDFEAAPAATHAAEELVTEPAEEVQA
jgi:small subunit ribosomal protein S6